MEPEEISWVAPEYYHYPKTTRWFWVSLIGAIIFVAIGLYQGNFLFAIFIAIAETLVVVWGRRSPPLLTFTLSKKGVRLDKRKFYPYNAISGFAFVSPEIDPDFEELVLIARHGLNSYVKIMVPKPERQEVENLLRQFLPEVEYNESLIEHIGHIVGF